MLTHILPLYNGNEYLNDVREFPLKFTRCSSYIHKMKDVQGIKRGKCNACECEEYRTPPSDSPSKFRCEYCNHTPVEHVKIIKLGKCKCGDCEKYQSEEENSYTECGYCGCEASDHAGAEKCKLN